MTTINSYLTFNGNCRDAMDFYKNCLGGELVVQTIGESPLADKLPAPMQECILHATLTNGNLVLMATDMVGEQGLQTGNAVSLAIHCSNEDEIRTYYEKLAEGGRKDHALEYTFWGALFGDLTDKYGNHWLLHFDQNSKQ